MKKLAIVAFVFGTIGFVLGNAFWYLASPLWIDVEVSETLIATQSAEVIRTGGFVDADHGHKGTGKVEVIRDGAATTIRFTEFEVTNGPDLYVWLVKSDTVEDSGDVKASETLELGRLKGNIGDQNYSLPEGASIEDWATITIWCRQFGVLFASAKLES